VSSDGERRQLTVMFCDLVGSTALSTQLDPEELRAVIQAYRKTCATVITRFGGHLAKYLGDGLLVYFDYPLAHEDDAQRAVRVGLSILAELPQLNARLQSTVGAHSRAPLQTDTIPLLAHLLSLPLPECYPLLTLTPQRQKQKTLEALLMWLLAEAERQPVAFIVEDPHWADPSTLEFLGLLIAQVPTARLLTILAFRPEFTLPWTLRSHITHLTLQRLPRQQVEEIVEKIMGDKTLPAAVVQQIVAKTDGVPLFVEELTKMVVESGLLWGEADRDVGARRAVPLPLAIPATLHDSLMARLDRLRPAKEVAQLGATLGREFTYELLKTVSPLGEVTLQKELAKLVEAELLYQRGLPPQATYLIAEMNQ
jgi:predicted ATPase